MGLFTIHSLAQSLRRHKTKESSILDMRRFHKFVFFSHILELENPLQMAGDKILVLGGTGLAGVCLIRELLHRQHGTVVFARNPAKLPEEFVSNKLLEVILPHRVLSIIEPQIKTMRRLSKEK